MSEPLPLTLGTAGHIDHGKTELVRALTGVDTDRLPEERQRGISIELGYASITLPGGRQLSVIDVPGHERFVRTMVAGATGIDLFLMAVAADDGVMPQTREHAAVLRALNVRRGVVAVTKSDLADPAEATRQAVELLPEAETVGVSARSGAGMADLWAALRRAAAVVRHRGPPSAQAPGAEAARLHIDRVFTIRGAGTVVTGTLWNGTLARGEQITVLPQDLRARVRSVQVHDEAMPRAAAGQRVALNLSGVGVSELARGDVVVSAGSTLRPSYVLDCELRFEAGCEPSHGARVQIHHGTRESPARMAWRGSGVWQLRLQRPLIAADGDRLVLRQIAPADTIGGGSVINAHARRQRPSRPARAALPESPAAPPPPQPLSQSARALADQLREAGLQVPSDSEFDQEDLAALRAAGIAVRVSRSLHLHAEILEHARNRVVALARQSGGLVTLAQVRDELHSTRRYAQALLEHLDSERVLIRRGEAHALRTLRAAQDATERRDGS